MHIAMRARVIVGADVEVAMAARAPVHFCVKKSTQELMGSAP